MATEIIIIKNPERDLHTKYIKKNFKEKEYKRKSVAGLILYHRNYSK